MLIVILCEGRKKALQKLLKRWNVSHALNIKP